MLHIRRLEASPEKLWALWELMQGYRTLFSDLTRGDVENFQSVMCKPYSLWLEVMNDHVPVGIIYFTEMDAEIDCNAHMIFFDRKPAEKFEVCRKLLADMFDAYPQLERMSATVPAIYLSTIRLAKKLGFRLEGTKRRGTLMGGKWIDLELYGILRSEVSHG